MRDKKKPENLEEFKKLCDEYLNGWKRAKADLINFKKDTEKRQQEFNDFIIADIILELLPIHNNFKRALNIVPKNLGDEQIAISGNKAWLEGIKHVKSQLDKFLENRGVSEIKTIGEKFNPELHEAVGKRKVNGARPDIIVEECSAGYTLNGRVIMAARVIVCE